MDAGIARQHHFGEPYICLVIGRLAKRAASRAPVEDAESTTGNHENARVRRFDPGRRPRRP